MASQIRVGQHTGVTKQPERQRYGLKATGNDPAENRLCRSHLVHMEGLWVVRQCEVHNRTFAKSNPAGLEGIADCQIVEIFAAGHTKSIGS